MSNISMIIGIFLVIFFTISAALDVGQPRPSCEGIYGWDLPATIFVVISIPFALGYLARNPRNKTIFDD